MTELDPSHHIFRHIKMSWIDGDFVDPAAFRMRQNEDGLSVNWVEYFGKSNAQEAVTPLRDVLTKKGLKIGGQSKFALLNVDTTKVAAAKHAKIVIVADEEPNDNSHALVKGYEAFNEQVAEELAKVVIATYPSNS